MRESTAEAVDIPAWLKNLPLAPEYRPTETEFADPIAFISSIEREAAAFGICKVIPPLPRPSKKYVLANLKRSVSAHLDHSSLSSASVDSAVFTTRHQELGARRGKPLPVQKQVWQSGEFYTLDQFEDKSKAFSRAQLGGFKEVNPLLIETLFWKAAAEKPIYVEYANDVPGSGFGVPDELLGNCLRRRRKQKRGLDEGSVQVPTCRVPKTSGENEVMGGSGWRLSNSPWNLQVIARSPGSLTRFMPDEVPGVTSPMVYIGMLFSWFAWHVEDHELHSLNFLHMGSPKTWYAVPGEHASTLEDIVRVQGYGGNVDRLAALIMLGEKTTLLSPEVLVASNVPCFRLVQHPGEFVVTFPRAYHVGFSHGFNCGEAANFATPKWLMVAKHAAVRRAAMNFLPMLSHQQLLYLLSISFISSVPRELLPGVRSSRLRDRKKEEREVIVKKAFLDDMMNESNILCALIAKAAISSAVLWEPDLLPSTSLVGCAQTHSSSLSTEALDPTNDERCTIKPQCESRTNDLFDHTGVACFTHHHHESLGSLMRKSSDGSPLATTYEDAHAYCMNAQSQLIKEVDEVDLPFGLNVDSGSLACVACGILGYPFMAILQPSEKAYRKLFSLEFEESNARQVSPESSHLAHMPYFVKNFLSEENYVDVEDQRNADLSAKSLPENIHTTLPVKNSSIVKHSSAHTTGDLIGEKADFSGSYTLTGSERLSSVCLFPATSLNNDKLIPNTAENQVCELGPQGMGDPCVQVERPCSGGSYKIKSDSLKGEHSSDGIKEPLQHISVKNNSKIEDKLCRTEFPGTTPSNGTNMSVSEAGPSDEITNWNRSNGFLRPRIFCLQHALEAVELLQSNGGVHVLVICHSDYLKIKALAISIAEEIDIPLKCEDIPLVNACPSTLDLINISIDEEGHEENGNNWTSKLGLNLKYCVKLKKQMPSNQDQLSLFLGGIFSDPSPASAVSNLKWLSRKSRTPLKVVGKTQSKSQFDAKVENFHPIDRNITSKTDSANAKKIYDSQNYVQNGENSKHPAFPIDSTLKELSRGNKSVVADAGNERSKCDPTNEEDRNQRVDDIKETLHNVPVEIAEYPQMHQVDWVSLEVSIFGDVGYSKSSHHAPASGRPDVSYSEELSETPSNGLSCREAVCDPTNSGCYLPCERLDMIVGVEAAYGSEDKSCRDRSQISIDVLTVESKTSKDVEHLINRGNLEDFVGDVESSCEPGMKPLRNCEIMNKFEGNCKKYLLSEDQLLLAESIIHSEIQLNNLAVQKPSGDDVSANPDKLEGMLESNKICSNKMQEKASESTEHIEDDAHHSKSDNQFIPDNLALNNFDMLQQVPCADKKVNVPSYDTVKSGTQIALDNSLKVAEIVSFSVESFAMQGVNAMELCVSTDTAFSLLNAKVDDLTKASVQTSLSSSMELMETEMTQQVVDSRGLCVSTDISSFQNDLHSANFYTASVDLIPYVRRGKKRKNEQEQEATCEDRSVSFVRSPCEGLRPRTRIRAYGQIDKFSPKKSCTRLERSPGNSVQREEKNKSSFKCVRSKTFKCDIEGCFMSFATRGDLSRHKRNFCTIDGCGKVFSSHKYAIRHQCVHEDCRPLKCPWKGCNMTFKWAWARIEHVRIHTGERPYKCKSPGCGQTFRFVSDFSRHRRKTGHYAATSAG